MTLLLVGHHLFDHNDDCCPLTHCLTLMPSLVRIITEPVLRIVPLVYNAPSGVCLPLHSMSWCFPLPVGLYVRGSVCGAGRGGVRVCVGACVLACMRVCVCVCIFVLLCT